MVLRKKQMMITTRIWVHECGFGFEHIRSCFYLKGGMQNGACAIISIRQAYMVLYD
jgi:hypothetical protein